MVLCCVTHHIVSQCDGGIVLWESHGKQSRGLKWQKGAHKGASGLKSGVNKMNDEIQLISKDLLSF